MDQTNETITENQIQETSSDEQPAAEAKPTRQAQNGVTLPAAGTKTRRIWDIADEISATEKRPALRAEVMSAAREEGLSDGTSGTQYGRWAAYNGVTREDLTAVREKIREEQRPVAAEEEEAPETEEGSEA